MSARAAVLHGMHGVLHRSSVDAPDWLQQAVRDDYQIERALDGLTGLVDALTFALTPDQAQRLLDTAEAVVAASATKTKRTADLLDHPLYKRLQDRLTDLEVTR